MKKITLADLLGVISIVVLMVVMLLLVIPAKAEPTIPANAPTRIEQIEAVTGTNSAAFQAKVKEASTNEWPNLDTDSTDDMDAAGAVTAVTNEYPDLDTDSTDDVTQDSSNLLTEGYFDVIDSTNLVFITADGSVTNSIDADIGTE